MVGLFLRLKWRLLVNGLARSRAARVSMGFGLVFAIGVGVVGGGATFALASTNGGATWLPLVFTLVFGAWVVLPIMAFGSDETLDPARLAMLPLGPRQLLPGLMAASTLSLGGLTTLLVASGPTLATRVSRAGVAPMAGSGGIVLLACLSLILMSVTASRVATTSLSSLLRSRRGRDAIATLSMLVGFSFYGLSQFPEEMGRGVQGLGPGTAGRATWGVLQWTPPGQAGLAAVRGLQGDAGYALAHLAVALLCTAGLAGLWWLALRRLQETPGAAARGDRTRLGLIPRPLRFLPPGRTTAVLSRELRHLGRHAGRRVRALQQSTFLLFPIFSLFSASDADPRLVLFAGGIGVLAMNEAALQFGSDGPALWAHVAAGGSWRSDVAGRNLALFLLQVPIGLVVIGLTAAITGGWRHALTALLVIPVGAMLGVAMGNVLSIRFPFPVPDMTSGNVFGQSSSQRPGCLFTLAGMASLVLVGGAVALYLGMIWQRAEDVVFLVAAVLTGWSVAGACWLTSLRATADEAQRRGPELLEKVSPR